MNEIDLAGAKYRIGRLNALQQFHVTRRLGPMLMVAGISVEALKRGSETDLDGLLAVVPHVMELLAKMSDDDVNYVLFTCMGCVQRQQEGGWANCIAPDGKTLMFADLEMPSMVRLVMEVMKVNLGNFLKGLSGGLPTSSP